MKKIIFAGETHYVPHKGDQAKDWFVPLDKLLNAYVNVQARLTRLKEAHPALYQTYFGTFDASTEQALSDLRTQLPATAGIHLSHQPTALPPGDKATYLIPKPTPHPGRR